MAYHPKTFSKRVNARMRFMNSRLKARNVIAWTKAGMRQLVLGSARVSRAVDGVSPSISSDHIPFKSRKAETLLKRIHPTPH